MTFGRKADRDRHAASVHSAGPRYLCPIEGCRFNRAGFARRDKLSDHMRKGHEDVAQVNGVWMKRESAAFQ